MVEKSVMVVDCLEAAMPRRRYPSDLTDAQWTRLEPLLSGVRPGGWPRAHPTRDVIDALRYVCAEGSPGGRSRMTALAAGYHSFRAGASTAPGSGQR